MMEIITLQQDIVSKASNAVVWLDNITPDLRLLNVKPQENIVDVLTSCVLAGGQLARKERTVLPLLSEPIYLLGSVCITAGYMVGEDAVITHNLLCDRLHRLRIDENISANLDIVRSVALPVYRRLIKDGRTHTATLLQSMLHIIAWRGRSQWSREQAQRILWMGGIFGKGGVDAVVAFDLDAAEKGMPSLPLYSLLLVTAFLSQFPAGPIFPD